MVLAIGRDHCGLQIESSDVLVGKVSNGSRGYLSNEDIVALGEEIAILIYMVKTKLAIGVANEFRKDVI